MSATISRNLHTRIRLLREDVNRLVTYKTNGVRINKKEYYETVRELYQARKLLHQELMQVPLEEFLKWLWEEYLKDTT